MDDSIVYHEATQSIKVAEVPLSHVSIEVGHFLMVDLENKIDRISAQFRRIAPLVDAFSVAARAQFGPGARVSTCFMVDDYFRNRMSPEVVLGKVLGAAEECGLAIDYVARESGCAHTSELGEEGQATRGIELAELVAARIVPEPLRDWTGQRPPAHEGGWLCNGQRSSELAEPIQAMRVERYRPPVEFGPREHSVFLDVEMWSTECGERKWSCSFLATVWQLLRLGMLRYEGSPVVEPKVWGASDPWPDQWSDLPTVIKLNPQAKPFAAYRVLSILPRTYIGVEHAVQLILDHLDLDREVIDKIVERGEREAVTVPREVTGRLEYVFLNEM